MEEGLTDLPTSQPCPGGVVLSPQSSSADGAKPDAVRSTVPIWKPALAVLLSLTFAGLGHLVVGAYLRAFAFLVPNLFLYTIAGYWPNGVLLMIVCFILAAFDAYSLAKNGRGIF